ncbi:MAG TPA: ABC transporter ATP-binding protein [Leptospiraceae bacterium]|nr:ABC transporter ATP-binding protein [Leptospiraceae bacterium]
MIRIQNLNKIYRGFISPKERILSALSMGFFRGRREYSALHNISFELKSGEICGIIGRNGAGKSTLLKVLSGVSPYDSGSFETGGTLRFILELGTGFNPELSGEENIYYNSLISGFNTNDLDKITEEIFLFSGLKDFRKIPLKNYSSGMTMRLAFAMATAGRPDNLLIDEAFAVGDAAFQQSCVERLKTFAGQGTSILIVSHDLSLLSSICSRMILLDKGKLIFSGRTSDTVEKYMELLGRNSGNDNENTLSDIQVSLRSERMISGEIFFISEILILGIEFSLNSEIDGLTVGFHIENQNGIKIYGTNTHLLKTPPQKNDNLMKKCIFKFPANMNEGKYSVSVSVHTGENHIGSCLYWRERILSFELEKGNHPKFEGTNFLPAEVFWKE